MTTTGPRSRRLTWDMQEMVALGFAMSVFALAGGYLAAGILIGPANGVTPAYQVLYATPWASPLVVSLSLSGLGLVWWMVEDWADIVIAQEDLSEDVEDAVERPLPVDAFGHLFRLRTLNIILFVTVLLIAGAAIAAVVAEFVTNPEGGAVVWSSHSRVIGTSVGTIVLCGCALLIVIRLVRRIREELSPADDGTFADVE